VILPDFKHRFMGANVAHVL